MTVNASAAEDSRAAVLRSRCAASPPGRGRDLGGALQGALRPRPRVDRESACGSRGALRLPTPARALAADSLAPSAGAARGGFGRGLAQARDLGLLPPRAGGGRAARLRARRSAAARGRPGDGEADSRLVSHVRLPRALFVCVGNAGRSQMAQALYERRGGEARSAGSRPEQALHESVVEAMDEMGISLAGRRPKPIAQE